VTLGSIDQVQGRGDSKVKVAEAEAEAVSIINEAVAEFGFDPTQYLLALRYLENFENIAMRANSRKILFPYEMELVGALNVVKE